MKEIDAHPKVTVEKINVYPNGNSLKHWLNMRDYSGVFECAAYFKGNKTAIEQAKNYMSNNPRKPIPDRDFINFTQDCSVFKKERDYVVDWWHITKEESQFPLAYSILFHQNVEQVENLLRIIYRPHNYYCLHLDADASPVRSRFLYFILVICRSVCLDGHNHGDSLGFLIDKCHLARALTNTRMQSTVVELVLWS